jgi:C-terminal processing protease CtpA/Prc
VGGLVPLSPAERAGVEVGDRLARINGSPTPERVDQAVALVRGPVGSVVELGFERPDGGSLDVSLRRERIAMTW